MREETNEPRILASRLRTPDGTILQSFHRHDYVTYTDKNGKQYMIDGGTEYVRRSAHGDEEQLTTYSDSPHEEIREHFHWGTYGIKGDQPRRWVKLREMETAHILAILSTVPVWPPIAKALRSELDWRGE